MKTRTQYTIENDIFKPRFWQLYTKTSELDKILTICYDVKWGNINKSDNEMMTNENRKLNHEYDGATMWHCDVMLVESSCNVMGSKIWWRYYTDKRHMIRDDMEDENETKWLSLRVDFAVTKLN